MPNQKTKPPTSAFDLKRFVFKLLSNWYWFILSTGIAYAVVYVINENIVPTYNVYTTILVDESNRTTENLVGGLQLFGGRKNLHNEIMVLTSYSLSYRTLKELDFEVSYYIEDRFRDVELYHKSPFVVQLDTAHKQQFGNTFFITIKSNLEFVLQVNENSENAQVYQFGEKIRDKQYAFTVKLKDSTINSSELTDNRYYFRINNLHRLASSYRGRLKVEPYSPSSSVLWLWIIGTVPQKEVDFLNKLTEVYTRLGLQEKNQIAISTINFIDNRLKTIVDSLRLAENKLQNFRINNPIVDISSEGETLLSRLNEYQTEKVELELQISYYRHLLQSIENENDFQNVLSPSAVGIDDQYVVSLLQKLGELYTQKQVKSYKVKDDNIPNIEVLEITIKNSRQALVKALKNNIEIATYSITDIEKKIDDIHRRMQTLPITERQMLNITRKFDLNDNIYTYLLQKRMEAAITQASNKSDVKVLDKARLEQVRREAPNTKKNRNTALLIGFIIPIMIFVALDFFNTKIIDRKDIENATNIPVIASLRHNSKKSYLAVYDNSKSPIAESFRALRSNLQYILVNREDKIITINSTVGGEGKTFCAINLASIIALSGKKTLLIGLDLRKPRIHYQFSELDNSLGISTYLIDKCKYEDIIQESGYNNFQIIPSGPIPPNPAELIDSPKMKTLLQKLSQQFEYIVIDTPPVGIVADSLLLTQYADANIFVLRLNYSRKSTLKIINQLHENRKFSNLSLVINDVGVVKSYDEQYGYGYGYGYGYTESQYYSDKKETRKWKKWLPFTKNG